MLRNEFGHVHKVLANNSVKAMSFATRYLKERKGPKGGKWILSQGDRQIANWTF